MKAYEKGDKEDDEQFTLVNSDGSVENDLSEAAQNLLITDEAKVAKMKT